MIRTTVDGRVLSCCGRQAHLIDEDRNAAVSSVRQHATEDHKHGGLLARHRPGILRGGRELRCLLRITEERECSFIVKRDGEGLGAGAIDVLTEDASVFRVWLDGERERIAVYADDETCVWFPRATGSEPSAGL
jgi:hypothetical protein